MSLRIHGNTKGLSPSELKAVEKLHRRSLAKDELVSLEFAREIFRTASQLRRRIGVLVSREGSVEEVILGTKEILYLPDLGRYRFGKGRLRRLRLIFSDLSTGERRPGIPHDIYTDLEKLRLDAVVSVKERSNRVEAAWAHLLALDPRATGHTRTELVEDLGLYTLDFGSFMDELEGELAATRTTEAVSGKTRAVLVGVYGKGVGNPESSMAELEELARTAGLVVADRILQRREPDPKTLLGKGKLEEVVLRCLRLEADMIVFDTELKPTQWRQITNSTELKVIDRSMLILDIFAQRATSSDGRLQVELAQLKYNLPRLVEKDAGLSRLSGGIGGRGPGETKLEIGRRRIRDRISELEGRIIKLGEQRSLRRTRRKERELPVVAILGYTNVGKSTLFNALTGSDVLAENKLFATLDPAQRRLVIPALDGEDGAPLVAVLSDTVGFIRELPAELTNAFRATLEELSDATLLVHVLDASDPEIAERKKAVDAVLATMELAAIPQIVVLNKIDRISPDVAAQREREFKGVSVSALQKRGFRELLSLVRAALIREGARLGFSRVQGDGAAGDQPAEDESDSSAEQAAAQKREAW